MAPILKRLYEKPALPPPDLLAHLQARGLACPDPVAALRLLECVGYYRLLVYMRPFQRPDPVTGIPMFIPGTCFDDVLHLYSFDRELRLLCLDAIERIEVALRAAIVSQVAVAHGPHFFLEPEHFDRVGAFVEFYQTACRDKRYLAIRHYEARYNAPELAPIWAIMEAITYGALSRLFSGLKLAHRKQVARRFGFDETVLGSWFRCLNLLRNMCAHHNRLWNAPMHVDQPVGAKKLRGEMGRTDSPRCWTSPARARSGSGGWWTFWSATRACRATPWAFRTHGRCATSGDEPDPIIIQGNHPEPAKRITSRRGAETRRRKEGDCDFTLLFSASPRLCVRPLFFRIRHQHQPTGWASARVSRVSET